MAAHAPLVGVVSWCVLDEEKEGRRYAFSLPLACFVSFVSQESAARERCVAAVSDKRIAVRHGRCASVCSAIFFHLSHKASVISVTYIKKETNTLRKK